MPGTAEKFRGGIRVRAGAMSRLELRVLLQAVGVLAVAAVVRAHGRLHVAHAPALGAQHAQEGGRVHGARAHLRGRRPIRRAL